MVFVDHFPVPSADGVDPILRRDRQCQGNGYTFNYTPVLDLLRKSLWNPADICPVLCHLKEGPPPGQAWSSMPTMRSYLVEACGCVVLQSLLASCWVMWLVGSALLWVYAWRWVGEGDTCISCHSATLWAKYGNGVGRYLQSLIQKRLGRVLENALMR